MTKCLVLLFLAISYLFAGASPSENPVIIWPTEGQQDSINSLIEEYKAQVNVKVNVKINSVEFVERFKEHKVKDNVAWADFFFLLKKNRVSTIWIRLPKPNSSNPIDEKKVFDSLKSAGVLNVLYEQSSSIDHEILTPISLK